jgi:hypothetical protein
VFLETPHHPGDLLDRHLLGSVQPADLRPVLHVQHPASSPARLEPGSSRGQLSAVDRWSAFTRRRQVPRIVATSFPMEPLLPGGGRHGPGMGSSRTRTVNQGSALQPGMRPSNTASNAKDGQHHRPNRPGSELTSVCAGQPGCGAAAGIEPATPSLPWNHQEPLCAPPYPQVARDRWGRSYRFSCEEVMRSLSRHGLDRRWSKPSSVRDHRLSPLRDGSYPGLSWASASAVLGARAGRRATRSRPVRRIDLNPRLGNASSRPRTGKHSGWFDRSEPFIGGLGPGRAGRCRGRPCS